MHCMWKIMCLHCITPNTQNKIIFSKRHMAPLKTYFFTLYPDISSMNKVFVHSFKTPWDSQTFHLKAQAL